MNIQWEEMEKEGDRMADRVEEAGKGGGDDDGDQDLAQLLQIVSSWCLLNMAWQERASLTFVISKSGAQEIFYLIGSTYLKYYHPPAIHR